MNIHIMLLHISETLLDNGMCVFARLCMCNKMSIIMPSVNTHLYLNSIQSVFYA